jgi:hypothetical protein
LAALAAVSALTCGWAFAAGPPAAFRDDPVVRAAYLG